MKKNLPLLIEAFIFTWGYLVKHHNISYFSLLSPLNVPAAASFGQCTNTMAADAWSRQRQ